MKIWADKWSCKGEIKGGTIQLKHRRFIITSNYTIDDIWKPEEDVELNKAIKRRFREWTDIDILNKTILM